MKASDKEMQCIDIAINLVKKRVEDKIRTSFEQEINKIKNPNFFNSIFSNKNKKEAALNNIESQISYLFKEEMQGYNINYEVPNEKSFTTLWEYKGLEFLGYSYRVQSEQYECIAKWFEILYGDIKLLEKLKNEVQDDLNKSAKEFYENNPGSHISMASAVSLLPKEIDKKFGKYQN